MLVKEVPYDHICCYPFNARRLKKDAGVWSARQSLLNILEHLKRARHVLNYVAADNHVGGHVGALGVVVSRGKSQTAVQFALSSTVTRVKSIATIARPIVIDQLTQEQTIAAADFNHMTATH